MWRVVKKIEEDEFYAVPESWILQNRTEMKYPLMSPFAITKMASKGEGIKGAYVVLKIKTLPKQYEAFEHAFDDSRRCAVGQRSRSSSEREVKGRGKRKKITKSFFTDSEAESFSDNDEDRRSRSKSSKNKSKRKRRSSTPSYSDNDDDPSMDEEVKNQSEKAAKAATTKAEIEAHVDRVKNLPPPPIPKPCEDPKLESTSNSQPSSSFMHTDLGSPAELRTPLKSPKSAEKEVSDGKTNLKKSSPLKSVKKSLFDNKKTKCKLGKKIKHPCGFRLSCSRDEEAILHTLCSLGALLEEIKFRLKKGRGGSDEKIQEGIKLVEAFVPPEIEAILTLTDHDSFKKFEDKLKGEQELFETLVKAYSWEHRHDSNLTTTARGVLRAILCENVLQLYTLKGDHAKKRRENKRLSFKDSSTYSLVNDVVRRIWMHMVSDYAGETNKTLSSLFTKCNKPEKPATTKKC